MTALELVVLGAGRMGMTHIQALRSSVAVRVVGVVDPDETARDRLSGMGIATRVSLDDLLDSTSFDAALIASPTSTHLHAIRQLVAAGVPILCEKPCGSTSADAREARTLASDAGVQLQVGYWRRFVPDLRALRDAIEEGAFGAVQWVSCFHWDQFPPPASFRRASGGIVVDMGVHEFDMTRWLTGEEITDAVGRAATADVGSLVEGDPGSLSFLATLSGGGLLSATLGRRYPPGDGCRVQVVGTERAADLPYLWPGQSEGVFEAALRAQAEAFAEWISGGKPQGATAEHAVAALAAAEMVTRSLG